MIVADVAEGIADALAGIPGLRIVPYAAEKVEPPGVMVGYPEIPYDLDLGDEDTYILPVYLFTSRVSDRTAGKELSDYVARTGPKSIKTAIEADRTLSGACDSVHVKRATPRIADLAGTSFLSVEFTLEVVG